MDPIFVPFSDITMLLVANERASVIDALILQVLGIEALDWVGDFNVP